MIQSTNVVIPGRDEVASPESILTPRLRLAAFGGNKKMRAGYPIARMVQEPSAPVVMDSGLDAFASPRNDVSIIG